MSAQILLVDAGDPVTQISAASLVLAFFIWGVLMGVAGIAIAWVVKGDRIREDEHVARPFLPGQMGVAHSEINDSTVVIPGPHVVEHISHELGRICDTQAIHDLYGQHDHSDTTQQLPRQRPDTAEATVRMPPHRVAPHPIPPRTVAPMPAPRPVQQPQADETIPLPQWGQARVPHHSVWQAPRQREPR
jgi:hypothetical protein